MGRSPSHCTSFTSLPFFHTLTCLSFTAMLQSPPNAAICSNDIDFHPDGSRGISENFPSPIGSIPKSPSVTTRQYNALSADR